jgi:hypothetical protein
MRAQTMNMKTTKEHKTHIPNNDESKPGLIDEDAHTISIAFHLDTDITNNETPPLLLLNNLESALTGVLLASRFLNTTVVLDLGDDIHKGFNKVLFNVFSGALLGFHPFDSLNHERIEGNYNDLIPLAHLLMDGVHMHNSSLDIELNPDDQ